MVAQSGKDADRPTARILEHSLLDRQRLLYWGGMSQTPLPSEKTMTMFGLSGATFVEQTQRALVWKVTDPDGQAAALKVYDATTMGNESAGFAYLDALNGRAAAKVMRWTSNVAVTEWLDGPSLGDMTRSGNDAQAAFELVKVASELHSKPLKVTAKLPALETWFTALFEIKIAADCPPGIQSTVMFCQALARQLVANQRDVCPLHGDLHHDNIRLGIRGYCAFDAKGVLGERAYELANAFRNPKGASTLVGDPDRIRFLRDTWSDAFKVPPDRLMQWAAVKCALSIAWRSGGTLGQDTEFDLLDLLVAISQEA